MIIRAIEPRERVEAGMIQTLAFLASHDYTDEIKEPEAHSKDYELFRAAFADDGAMMACMEVIPFTVMFDGHEVGMAGIGGVASLPEYRRQGAVREIFRAAMAEMRDNGQLFSYLYPFSHEYYRQFGYELCYDRLQIKLKLERFMRFAPSGELAAWKPGGDIAPYQRIYREFIKGKNLAVLRSDERFEKRVLGDNPHKNKVYAYLWRDDDREPGAYLAYGARKENGDDIMDVREFAWTGPKALTGMLSCLPRFTAQFDKISWQLGAELAATLLAAEPYHIDAQLRTGGMNRIVDVEKALALLACPGGSGRAVIDAKDGFLPWNDDVFTVEWDNGGLAVSRGGRAPDMVLTAARLVQLACGYMTPGQLAALNQIEIAGDINALCRLFPQKAAYMADYF